MSKIISYLALKMMPFLPKSVVGIFAKRYIAGTTICQAINKAQKMNQLGFAATIDVLGEFVSTLKDSQETVATYTKLLDSIQEKGVNSTISLKLTHCGLLHDEQQAWKNLRDIIKHAKTRDISVTIDMEDSSITDTTLKFYSKAREITENVRAVIQAYLIRSKSDMDTLLKIGAKLRLCKGIYKEPADIALQDKTEIRENFIRLAELYLGQGGYLALATHDLKIIERIVDFIDKENIPAKQYEFQALLGVPIMQTLKQLRAENRSVRMYIPFGQHWFEYAKRRIQENPDIAAYVIKNIFTRR